MIELASGCTHGMQPVESLTPVDRSAMFDLMQRYYLGVTQPDFERDLDAKEKVIVLRDGSRIVGFSTVTKFELPVARGPVLAIFSGDTIVDESYRNTAAFPYHLSRFALDASKSAPIPLYYVLICKGWRTYRTLPYFFRDYFPSPKTADDPELVEVADAFGRSRYPQAYRPEAGVLTFSDAAQRVRPGSSEAAVGIRRDRHAEFFFAKNPGYLNGDELICVARVARENFAPLFWRFAPDQ